MKACQLKPTLNVIYTLIKVCVFLYCFIPIQLVINTSNHTYKITASLQLSSSLQAKKPDTASHSSSKAVKTNTAPAHLDATWLKIAQQKISAKPIPAMLKKLQKITPCSSSTKNTHIAVRFHLSLDPNRTIQDEIKWLALQLNTANQLFESIQVCFSVQSLLTLPKASMHMKTRTQRTALGRKKKRLQKGSIDIFIVSRLNDVDRIGEQIRGVHWRDPKDRKFKRWIILSRIAQAKVLAHELGHYFSLPHSKYAASIMNKTPRKKPPMSQRGFVKQEIKQMRKAKKKMLAQKHLVAL